MIEGPSCPLGGGACQNVALMKVDGRMVQFERVMQASAAVDGKWSSEYRAGEMTLRTEIADQSNASSRASTSLPAANLIVKDPSGKTITAKGVSRCEAD